MDYETLMAMIRSGFADQNKSFEAFRAASDKRIAEIANHMTEAQQIIEKLEKNQSRLMLSGVSHLNDPEVRESRAGAAMFRAFINRTRGAGAAEYVATEDLVNYRRALNAYIRRGADGMGADYRNAMSVGSDPDGGFYVPADSNGRFVQRMYETSPMRSIASVVSINSDALEGIYDADDATSGGWVAENEARNETDTPQAGVYRITAHEQFSMPVVTQKILDDADRDIEDYLTMKIADKLGRVENGAFVSGDGVGKPKGFLTYKNDAVPTDDDTRSWGVLQYVATGSDGDFPVVSGSIAKDDSPLHNIVAKLKTVYRTRARWVMNRATASFLAKLKDADGRRLWRDSLEEGQPDRLLGYPVTLFEDMPDVASNSFSIAFGDFTEGYTIADRLGIRLLRDPYTTKGKVKFYSFKRVGGDVVNFDAIKLLKFGTS